MKYDLIIVGSGFASSFFLSTYLKNAKASSRVVVLERGRKDSHAWQIQNRRNSSMEAEDTFVNSHPTKQWVYNPGFGGGSNCWWACTPRMLPNDFRLHSLYGVGVDWPLTYDELEDNYYEIESSMSVSGSYPDSPFPRRNPYPHPPHRFSQPDTLLKQAFPNHFFHQPTARARMPTSSRPPCCASGVCRLCPINSKFTIQNELGSLYEDPRVTVVLEAAVQSIETIGGMATGVHYLQNGTIKFIDGELIVLGANALFNPHILLRSNLTHPALGKGLHEQISTYVTIDLDGVDNFQGSTSITGHGYMLYDGPHRSSYAAALIETFNIPALRTERKKWRQRMRMKVIWEDLPSEQNFVTLNAESPEKPEVVYVGHSAYTQRAISVLPDVLPQILQSLPIERLEISRDIQSTEAHIIGTTVMGNDPQTSIVDRYLVHHTIRNLVVLGSGVFPTSSPANPTLTLSALSLWSANHLFT